MMSSCFLTIPRLGQCILVLIQKSKSSTNLNHKEGKQEEKTID